MLMLQTICHPGALGARIVTRRCVALQGRAWWYGRCRIDRRWQYGPVERSPWSVPVFAWPFGGSWLSLSPSK